MFGFLWFELLVVVVIVVVPIEASQRGYILYLYSTKHADLFLKLDGRALEKKIQERLILLQSSKILVWWLVGKFKVFGVVACCCSRRTDYRLLLPCLFEGTAHCHVYLRVLHTAMPI